MFSCSNPEQNQLLTDTCISVGVPIPGEPILPLWMSPDIILNDPKFQTSTLIPPGASIGTAMQGANNQVSVRAHKSCTPPGATFMIVELYVAHPGLNITPAVNSLLVFTESIPIVSFGSSILVTQTWLADHFIASPSTQPDTDPNRLHRCLIARCYPDTLTATGEKFCVLEDQHVAQRNIFIIPVKDRKISFLIQTSSQNSEIIESATIRTIADRAPSTAVLNAILPSLKQFKGFRQLAQTAPERFALQVPNIFSPVIRDGSRLEKPTPVDYGNIPIQDKLQYVLAEKVSFARVRDVMFNPRVVLQKAVADRKFNTAFNARNLQVSPESQIRARNLQVSPESEIFSNAKITPKLEKLVQQAAPTFEADIKLPPKEVANFNFTADLPENSQPGDAHIFHVMHINDQKQVIGGLTIVAVVE